MSRTGYNHVIIGIDKLINNKKKKYLDITFWVKYNDELIVRLKIIKSKEDIFCYLSFYLHCSFLWYLVIIKFIYCIIKYSMPKLLYYIKNVCLYCFTIRLSAGHWVTKALNYCKEVLEIEILSRLDNYYTFRLF